MKRTGIVIISLVILFFGCDSEEPEALADLPFSFTVEGLLFTGSFNREQYINEEIDGNTYGGMDGSIIPIEDDYKIIVADPDDNSLVSEYSFNLSNSEPIYDSYIGPNGEIVQNFIGLEYRDTIRNIFLADKIKSYYLTIELPGSDCGDPPLSSAPGPFTFYPSSLDNVASFYCLVVQSTTCTFATFY